MRFRAVRASTLGQVDAIIVPLSSDGGAPAGLPRSVKTVVDRVAKGQAGAGRPYGVTPHHGEPPSHARRPGTPRNDWTFPPE